MKTIKSKKEFLFLLKEIYEATNAAPAPVATAPAAPSAPSPTDPAAATATTTEQEPITLDDIIEKLNIIRSGRSTKDDDVKSELENYILQFSEEDKSSLLAFLDGLGRILTTEDENAQIQNSATPEQPAPTTPAPTPTPAPAPKSTPSATKKSSAVPINVGGI